MPPRELELLLDSLKEHRKAEEQAIQQASKSRGKQQKISLGG